MSLPVAKNAMRRAIEALFYRPLNKKEKDLIWKYFKSHCAYCNKLIDRDHRHGHMDHLDCSAFGGGNYIRNRVLACKECNGNEKREHGWKQFMKVKTPAELHFAWYHRVAPLLQEYFYNDGERLHAVLGDSLMEKLKPSDLSSGMGELVDSDSPRYELKTLTAEELISALSTL